MSVARQPCVEHVTVDEERSGVVESVAGELTDVPFPVVHDVVVHPDVDLTRSRGMLVELEDPVGDRHRHRIGYRDDPDLRVSGQNVGVRCVGMVFRVHPQIPPVHVGVGEYLWGEYLQISLAAKGGYHDYRVAVDHPCTHLTM